MNSNLDFTWPEKFSSKVKELSIKFHDENTGIFSEIKSEFIFEELDDIYE